MVNAQDIEPEPRGMPKLMFRPVFWNCMNAALNKDNTLMTKACAKVNATMMAIMEGEPYINMPPMNSTMI